MLRYTALLITALLITALLSLTLNACSGQATLLPQGDNTFKVVAQGPTTQAARNAADSEATKTCRKFQQVHKVINETTGVLDSTEPGETQYRIIWQFHCVDRGY